MKPIHTIKLGTSVLALSIAAGAITTPAYAAVDHHTSEYVKEVHLSFPGQAGVITVKNTSANKHVNAVKLGVAETNLDIDYSGSVYCKDSNSVHFRGGSIGFGPMLLTGNSISSAAILYKTNNIDIAVKDQGEDIVEAAEGMFSVPLNKIKSGSPALRVDPIEEINKKLQAHLQGGDSKVDFYKQDHDIVLQRPVSLTGVCGPNNPNKNTNGFRNSNFTIQIKYKGDAEVNDKPVLNAQLQGNNPNQVQQNPDLPFVLNDVQFQPNLPYHFGKCVPDQNPKIRMNFTISGGKQGEVDLRVTSYSNQYADYGHYYETTGIVKNPKNSGGYLDFYFPLKEMLSQDKYSYMAISNNKTYNHNMKIQARFKNFDSDTWSQWKDFDTAVYKHRCVPQVSGQLGGSGAKIGGYDNGGDTPKFQGTIQAAPTPKPPLGKTPVEPASKPARATTR